MGLIREPLEVDFYINSRPLTEEEERLLSEFIRNQKRRTARAVITPAKQVVMRRKKEFA